MTIKTKIDRFLFRYSHANGQYDDTFATRFNSKRTVKNN